MESTLFEIESKQPFSESKIWQFNRDFYNFRGISAFSEDIVPHHLTSNSFVGKTYAELIFGFLKDLSVKGKTKETVYIVELGAGHGRLAFHILTSLQKLIEGTNLELPKFCYVLTDIVEENLLFFQEHPQFKMFYQMGILDVSFFDAIESKSLILRNSKTTINPKEINQPVVAIANYFFDSIPSDLFFIKDEIISNCTISINSTQDPIGLNPEELIEEIELSFQNSTYEKPFYKNPILSEILEAYRNAISESYLFFPEKSMLCIDNLRNLSEEGLLLLSMDKGFHEIHDLENKKEPDVVTHGSYSIWVNFHALGTYCERLDGKILFPSLSTFHLELGSLLFLKDGDSYYNTIEAYQKFVNDFGPDDFNTLKHLSYANLSRIGIKELIAFFRLSVYDSTYFIMLLPRFKKLSKAISFNERTRIAETFHKVWAMYFYIGEPFDLAYEIGSVFYDLGLYNDALDYFKNSVELYGQKPDTYYNIALTYYQLRQDKLLFETIVEAKAAYPDFELFKDLDKLDVS